MIEPLVLGFIITNKSVKEVPAVMLENDETVIKGVVGSGVKIQEIGLAAE